MSYRQYTKCASISSFVGFTWVQYVMVGGAAIVAGLLATLLAGGVIVPVFLIAALTAIIAYCLWWLYDRLICLGGDVCAVGFVLTVETPDEKTGLDSFDTDYSLNLVLPPTLVGTAQKDVEKSVPLGNLVQETSDVANYRFAGYHLPFQGDLVTKFSNGDPYGGQFTTACLHAEFEGGGVYDLLQSCQTDLALATITAAVCSIPVIGWIACLILSVAALGITLTGISNANVIIGFSTSTEPSTAFLYANGVFKVISVPNSFYTIANGIAPGGLITGMTLPNEASVGLHRALGFEPVGTYRSIGWKHGAWHDVAWVQRGIG